jgi:hypothetical protein
MFFLIDASVIRDAEGRFVMSRSVAIDVTELRKIEKEQER